MSNYDLIARVYAKPEIWLSTHPLYMKRTVLRKFWARMSRELGKDETLLKKRWKHLKDQYRKELKKVLLKVIPENIVPWQYYEAMSFLKDDVIRRDRERIEVCGKSKSDEESEHDESLPERVSIKEEPKLQTQTLQKAKVLRRSRLRSVANPKLKLIMMRVNETKELVEERLRDMHDDNRNDPDYLFLMSLLPSVRQLTELQKLQFKSKINDWLLQEITLNTYSDQHGKFVLGEVKME